MGFRDGPLPGRAVHVVTATEAPPSASIGAGGPANAAPDTGHDRSRFDCVSQGETSGCVRVYERATMR